MSGPRKRKETKKQQREREEQQRSARYSTGYRFALYDPVNPDAPLLDIETGGNRSYKTFTHAEIKEWRSEVRFANDVLVAAGARFLVGVFQAALTGYSTIDDGDLRVRISNENDSDEEGEEWKKGGEA